MNAESIISSAEYLIGREFATELRSALLEFMNEFIYHWPDGIEPSKVVFDEAEAVKEAIRHSKKPLIIGIDNEGG